MGVALRFPAFPITLETYREVLRDVFDLPGLVELLRVAPDDHRYRRTARCQPA